jgi:phage terminase small subunit
MVAKYGEVMYCDGAKKVLQVSPYASARNNAEKRLTKHLESLGLTPVARARLRVNVKKTDISNPWSGLLN